MTGDQTVRQASQRSSASIFAELADALYAHRSEDDIYGAICRSAPALVTGCDHASIMIKRNDTYRTVGSSDEIAAQADALERELANGPCVDAIEEEMVQVDSDLTVNCQWPVLAKRLLAMTPIRGMAGFRLLIDGKKVGARTCFLTPRGRSTTNPGTRQRCWLLSRRSPLPRKQPRIQPPRCATAWKATAKSGRPSD